MMRNIQVEDLMRKLEEGTGYKHIDNKKMGYFHYEFITFSFGKDNVTIQRNHGYDGEEDMASEWFGGE